MTKILDSKFIQFPAQTRYFLLCWLDLKESFELLIANLIRAFVNQAEQTGVEAILQHRCFNGELPIVVKY